jgi:hypothetical protein
VKNRKFQYGKDVQCSSDLLVAIIILEQAIQELAKLEDQWKEEHQASLKSFSQGEDMVWIQECEEMIMYHRNLGDWVGRILYHLEVRLPRGTLKNSYDKLREDPTWYLRKELVKDCVAKGGCCGRDCGCCAKRHLNSEKRRGIGHCSTQCACCESHRGSDFTDGKLFELRDLMVENLNDPDPTYLLAMADAYFLPPETPGLKGNVVRMCKQIKKAFKIN